VSFSTHSKLGLDTENDVCYTKKTGENNDTKALYRLRMSEEKSYECI